MPSLEDKLPGMGGPFLFVCILLTIGLSFFQILCFLYYFFCVICCDLLKLNEHVHKSCLNSKSKDRPWCVHEYLRGYLNLQESLFDKNLIVCNHTFGKYNRFLFTGRTILTENNLQSAAALIDRSFKSADVVSWH